MNEELWNTCEDGTLEGIAKAQHSRNSRRSWTARSLTALIVLVVPSVALIGLLKPASISCQQTVAMFESARTENLAVTENRSFKMHLLFCGKCRNSYADYKSQFQVSVIPVQDCQLACYDHHHAQPLAGVLGGR